MIKEFDDIMNKATLSQIADFIKNGDFNSEILQPDTDSYNAINKLEFLIRAKVQNTNDADEIIDAVNSCIFLEGNISFYNGFHAGARLLKELLQI